MSGMMRLEQLIEKSHTKCRDFHGGGELEAFGVSNTDGITRTAHRKSDDLGDYLVIEPGSFAYNPYRINVGSIGLTPDGLTGVVSPAYIVFRAKENLIPEVLLDFLKSSEGLRQINKLASGAVRKALRFEDLCEIEFPALSYERQIEILKHKQGFNQQHGRLLSEITHQETLLAKLKQAILQEAIAGKLTADWRAAHPDAEPASQLLHRIQAEKARLIATKKLRPEKPLPKIIPAEFPFEIPKCWEWCRLGQLIELVSGQHIEAADYNQAKRGVPYLTGPSDFGPEHPTYTRWTEKPKVCARKGDLLVTVKGSGVGKMNVLLDDGVAIGRQLMAVRPCIVHEDFIVSYLKSQYEALQGAKAGQIPGIGRDDILDKMLPLPPLAEQAAIVARVEVLMEHCRALAAEIAHTRTHAAHLLQAVLKEAFAPASA